MLKKTASWLLLSVIMLSACSNQAPASTTETPAATTEQSTSNTPATTPESSETATTPATEGTTSTEATTPEQSSESTTAKDTEATAPAEYTYHMNKNYDIVPNEESKETPKKVVLLTFDDGPKEKKMINSMMDTLDKHHAKAIFFVNGYRIKTHPELLKLIHDRGGIIGNHTQDHIVLKHESKAKVTQQIEDTQKLIEDTINEAPRFLRAPNGATNDTVHALAKKHDMLYMNWSVGSLDWVNQKDPDAVISNVMDQLHSGSIILMHELPWTVEALDELLTKLEAKGYTFVDPNAIEPKMR
ncbi:peptidoglycan/xylan/chitin deacetylase (PgdA/CDA1 family) [Paenibacillus sp. SORGH_AS306]|uniref:Polysaccharide deacetylase family protein n=1 Tax=Paenibacillus kyungheensis TaxID=1452732 RepID=A0AAX3LWR7_9BACL|nr:MULTISPECIES: polysaccharide deacetylase family protein [Paenibacillus]MDQ1234757.1 peptidoglycan/xylan/chitin deacetylase (PgdA/CDA1 family) [Paenibacillus sp. SORGH_AS_0306]MDR6111804.1 peptidoglycan/xylan/chitin deacetylase (PgdA/CDA1 family) [Paenibacillus sp. SORGH_AS_0338]WCT54349.1 polysaccharide deacetylase family protein [Paenibacillus kyungheensis]